MNCPANAENGIELRYTQAALDIVRTAPSTASQFWCPCYR